MYLQIRARICAAEVCNQGRSQSEYLMDSEPKRKSSLLHECPGIRFRSRPDTYLACSVISRNNTHEAIARWRHMCCRVRVNGRLSLMDSSTPSRSCRLHYGLHRADCRIAVNERNCQLRMNSECLVMMIRSDLQLLHAPSGLWHFSVTASPDSCQHEECTICTLTTYAFCM